MKILAIFLLAFLLTTYSTSHKLHEYNNYPHWINNPFSWRFSPKFYQIYFDHSRVPYQKNQLDLNQNHYFYNDKIVGQFPSSYRTILELSEGGEGQSNDNVFHTEFRRLWPVQQRLFFNLFNPSGLFGPFFRPSSSSSTLSVSTRTSIVSSTVTTVVISSCVSKELFLAAVNTAPCPERKRSSTYWTDRPAYELLDLSSGAPIQQLMPSNVDKVELTSSPSNYDATWKELSSSLISENQISSSKAGLDEDTTTSGILPRMSRQMANMVVTSTVTQYIFFSTVVKKPVALVAGAYLNCLPKGLIICNP